MSRKPDLKETQRKTLTSKMKSKGKKYFGVTINDALKDLSPE